MSRARILADYVSSGDELADKAPIAGPTFTGTVAIPNVANLETAVVANTAKVTNYNQTLADINALDITELGTVTSGNLENTAIVYPAGHVLQTLNFFSLYGTSTTSTSYQNVLESSGVVWEPSITPSSTSSKVLFTASICVQGDNNGAAEGRGDIKISTQIGAGSYVVKGLWNEGIGAYDRGGGGIWVVKWLNWSFLQATSTTSAVKMKIEIQNRAGGDTVAVGGNSRLSTITLQEIAG